MKRKIIGALLAAVVLLSACGKTESDKSLPPVQTTNETESSTTEITETDKADESIKEEETIAEAPASKVSAMDCTKAYQRFLNDEENVYFDKDWYREVHGASSYPYFGKGDGPFTFSEFVKNYCKKASEEDGFKVEPTDIKYSFIDCGNDGIPELALEFADVDKGYMEATEIFILKWMEDEKLQLCFATNYGYRTYGYLTENGVYYDGGSAGAAVSIQDVRYIDKNGDAKFVYGEEDTYSIYSLYLPGFSDSVGEDEMAELDELSDAVIKQVYFETYKDDKDYSEFIGQCHFTCADAEYMDKESSNTGNTSNLEQYQAYIEKMGLSYYKPEALDKLIEAHFEELGITKEMREAKEVQWITVGEDQMVKIYAWRNQNTKQYVLEEPAWEYYCVGPNEVINSGLKLKQVSAAANDIIDDYNWFDMLSWEKPAWNSFSDDQYTYNLYGGDTYYPYMMDIVDKNTLEVLYTLDFSNYYYPDEKNEDTIFDFVEESIHWATTEGDVLYVCTSHNTYASSAPHNAYITAIDLENDCEVLWRTEPLTSNAKNFVVYDNYIICGYGFTAEPDFVYVLDRESGHRIGTYKVKTGPDYFYIKDNQLYVRTYDMDYVFDLAIE